MPKSPFQTYQEFVKKSPRNSFDMSWRNYLSLKFGYLTPCFLQDVTSGDSMSLETAFALNFMPTVFPLQTPIRVNVHFFYVRYRNLWKHWEDFRWNNKTPVHPFIKNDDPDFFKTGSLADYLGVPTTVASGSRLPVSHPVLSHVVELADRPVWSSPIDTFSHSYSVFQGNGIASSHAVISNVFYAFDRGTLFSMGIEYFSMASNLLSTVYPGIIINENQSLPLWQDGDNPVNVSISTSVDLGSTSPNSVVLIGLRPDAVFHPNGPHDVLFQVESVGVTAPTNTIHNSVVTFPKELVEAWNSALGNGPFVVSIVFRDLDGKLNRNTTFTYGNIVFNHQVAEPFDVSRMGDYNPFMHTDDDGLRLNALPFRAYEQIYNSYYRNERVEPFMKDGEVQYNDFLTTDDDGPDGTPYHLFKRNWEYDFLTSALPSPQQGTAPIVGVDIRHITFQDGDRLVHYRYNTESDGETLAPGGHFEETDVSNNVRSTAVDLIANGFSINAFRDANAMQIFLEKNIRRGLRYKDQHMSHTGVELDYAELDLPEFIGGVSQYVKAEQITNMAAGSAPLGDYAGQLSAFGEIKHKINHFFREDGIVMGIMSVVPQPAYSQLLPKYFLRTSALDYFNSEFTHLGMQPIPMSEVAPLQTYAGMRAGTTEKTLNSTFGYQRPNYDMVARVDEVHGQMRTTMRNFVMNRTFTDVPELGAEFVHVDPAQLNQVFQFTNEGDDTCFGQIAFKCFMKRPVPRVGEPRLEA